MSLRILLVLTLILGPAPAPSPAGPYPKGRSTQEHAGLSFELAVPEDYDPGKEYSLLVALHGAGSSGKEFITWFEQLTADEFVVCAPKSTGPAWSRPDLKKVKEIVRHLSRVFSIGKGRLHATGFSNGGFSLPFLVFDPDLPFATACFMGSGFTGGRVPKRARKEMAVLALAGEKDPFLDAARRTPERLRGKVRYAEFRAQPDLAHRIPGELLEYYQYFLEVMEGRFEPGVDHSFDWVEILELGLEDLAEKKTGALVYFFSEKDGKSKEAKHLQHVVFFDPLVRFYGGQLVPMLLDVECEAEGRLFAKLGFTKTPAVAVLRPDLTPVAVFEGKVPAPALVKALRSLARTKRPPR